MTQRKTQPSISVVTNSRDTALASKQGSSRTQTEKKWKSVIQTKSQSEKAGGKQRKDGNGILS